MAKFESVACGKLHVEIASEDAMQAVVREAKQKGPSERCHGRKLGPVSCFTETSGRAWLSALGDDFVWLPLRDLRMRVTVY